jgi:hypothetical protein
MLMEHPAHPGQVCPVSPAAFRHHERHGWRLVDEAKREAKVAVEKLVSEMKAPEPKVSAKS